MGWISNLPIGRKVLITGLLPSIIGLALATTALYVNEKQSLPIQISIRVDQLAEIIGDNAVAALAFDDTDTGQMMMDTLQASPNILSAAIFNPDGETFVQYQRADIGDAGARIPEVDNRVPGRRVIDGQIEVIREQFKKTDLIKIRIEAEKGRAVDAIANTIVETVPCELVARRGFVAILYCDGAAKDASAESSS